MRPDGQYVQRENLHRPVVVDSRRDHPYCCQPRLLVLRTHFRIFKLRIFDAACQARGLHSSHFTIITAFLRAKERKKVKEGKLNLLRVSSEESVTYSTLYRWQ